MDILPPVHSPVLDSSAGDDNSRDIKLGPNDDHHRSQSQHHGHNNGSRTNMITDDTEVNDTFWRHVTANPSVSEVHSWLFNGNPVTKSSNQGKTFFLCQDKKKKLPK